MFDTERLTNLGLEYLADAYNLNITSNMIDSMRGLDNDSCAKIFNSKTGGNMDFAQADAILTAYAEGYIKANGVPVKDGLFKLLNYLKSCGIKAAVATSSPRPRACSYLSASKVMPFFKGVVCAEDVNCGKPAPDIFLKAVSVLGYSAKECLVLEDSENGLKGAISSGCITAYVKDICPVSEKIINQTDAVCETLNDVIRFIDAYNAA